jgi:hypothetical protein
MRRNLLFAASLAWFAASAAVMVWSPKWGHALAFFFLGVGYAIAGASVEK